MPSPDNRIQEADLISLSKETRSSFVTFQAARRQNNHKEPANLSAIACFGEVHPMHPFLDSAAFELRAFSLCLPHYVSANKEWRDLYHTILAIASLYHDHGSFAVCSGTAWRLFRVALSLFPRLIFGLRTFDSSGTITAST